MNIRIKILHYKSFIARAENILLVGYWAYLAFFQRITKAIAMILGIDYEILDILLWIIVVAITFDTIVKGINLETICFVIVVFTVFIMSGCLWKNNMLIKENFISFITGVFPFYFIGKCVVVDEHIMHILLRMSKLSIIINILVYFLYHSVYFSAGERRDMLGIAYMLLPHVLIITYNALQTWKGSEIIWMIVSSIFLIGLGSRGPVLIEVALIGICFLFKTNGCKKMLIVGLSLMTVFIFALFGRSELFLQNIFVLLQRLGISTRVMSAFLGGRESLFSGSGREDIWISVINSIKEHPFVGIGPYGETLVVEGGYYAHNVVLEILVHYGIFVGSFFILCFVGSFLLAFRRATKAEKDFLLILLFSVIGKLMISATYTADLSFFFMIGYLATFRRKRVYWKKEEQIVVEDSNI